MAIVKLCMSSIWYQLQIKLLQVVRAATTSTMQISDGTDMTSKYEKFLMNKFKATRV